MFPSVGIYDFSSYEPECCAHELWEPVTEIPELSADTPVGEAIELIKKTLSVNSVEINMRNDKFVDYIVSRLDNKRFKLMLPCSKISEFINSTDVLRDIQIDEGFYQNEFENIDSSFPYIHLTFKQIGIPCLDIIQVSTEKGLFYIELSGDIKYYETIFN